MNFPSFLRLLVKLEDLGAASQRSSLDEAQGVGESGVGVHAIVAGENHTSTITPCIRPAAFRIRALHQHRITVVVGTVALHQDLIVSGGVSHAFLRVCQFRVLSLSALDSYNSTCNNTTISLSY